MSNFTEDQKLAILKNFILENAAKNVTDIFDISISLEAIQY